MKEKKREKKEEFKKFLVIVIFTLVVSSILYGLLSLFIPKNFSINWKIMFLAFVMLNLLDIQITYRLINKIGIEETEQNPIVKSALKKWGKLGAFVVMKVIPMAIIFYPVFRWFRFEWFRISWLTTFRFQATIVLLFVILNILNYRRVRQESRKALDSNS